MPLAESIATLSSYLPTGKSARRLFFVKISYYEIMLHYAPIARPFKVDSAGSGKVSALSRANAARAENWSDVRPCGVRHETDE
jgi:hypothetical protein